jgi:hypothetical protein
MDVIYNRFFFEASKNLIEIIYKILKIQNMSKKITVKTKFFKIHPIAKNKTNP